MLPLATAHIVHLYAKVYTGGWEFKPFSLIDPTYIIRNIVVLRETNKLLLYSQINTKYLIIVNNFFVI